MAITRTPIVDDDGTGTTGTVLDNAWKQELYNQIDGVAANSPWIALPLTLANFSMAGGTISGVAIVLSRYRLIGANTIVWSLTASPVTIGSGSATSVTISGLPFSLTQANANAVAASIAPAFVLPNGTHAVDVRRLDGAPWTAGTNWFYWTAIFEGTVP
jgi:hypothetical protein